MMRPDLKTYAGALTIDGPRLLRCLAAQNGWCRMRNRDDRLTAGPDDQGWRCEWEFSRTLHVCDVFPPTGRWLLRQALRQWPVVDLGGDRIPDHRVQPAVSFIIGHRGLERLPHLRLTLESIRRQIGVDVECIVVEQDSEARLRATLPEWVHYHQAPLPESEMRYSRAAAFNAGAQLARGKVLVLHDNDLPVPRSYAAEVWRLHQRGYDACNLGRFVFYLERLSTERLLNGAINFQEAAVERVVENSAGGTTAISRDAFAEIGGMDEAFIGWGGEDNEFWSRCLTRKVWDFGYLPLIHLWHPSLADRSIANPALALCASKQAIPAEERIRTLCAGCKRTSSTHTGKEPALPGDFMESEELLACKDEKARNTRKGTES